MDYACEKCGHVGPATPGLVGTTKTLFWVFVIVGAFTLGILWLVALVMYLASDKHAECRKCKALDPIPVESPRGKQLADSARAQDTGSQASYICDRCRIEQAATQQCRYCANQSLFATGSDRGRELLAEKQRLRPQ